ncbi:glucosidase II beta subunit-like-domain-containing protein, partial [Amylostereum chailletii]
MHFGLLSILPFFISTVASSVVDQTHGVPPALLSRYVPDGKRWTCLDGSKDISWTSVNDDYCDCPDGSDEPGTGACPNTTFHCTNKGHIGSIISGTRVRDGLCEPECCDGSDEPSGVCPNKCKEVGEAYRTKREAEHKLRKTGSKIRASYISFAQKEKKRLEGTIADLEKDMAAREEETSRLKDIVDRTEALSAEALEAKKQSPLYTSLISHSNALKSLQREHKKHLEREKALGDILDTLRRGYNPNYQDMAVLEAVRGWEYLEKLPHINDVSRDESGKSEESEEEEEEELEEGMWTADELDTKLDPLLRTDYVSLLLEHDNHVGIP